MKQIKSIITVLILFSTHRSESLPVTSIALENDSEQLIWQTAWYSQRLNGDKKDSPFKQDGRRITAKSIFITPNFNQNASHCPLGYKLDDSGKCIKFVNINKDDILVTRLQNYFSSNQTSDYSMKSDYDYSLEEDDTNESTQMVPINDKEALLNAIEDFQPSTEQYKVELSNFSFTQTDSVQNNLTSIIIGELFLKTPEEEKVLAVKNITTQENATFSLENSEVNDSQTASAEHFTSTEPFEGVSIENTETTLSELSGEKSEGIEKMFSAEMAINSTTVQSDDYFDALLFEESFFVDKPSSSENMTGSDYDFITTTELYTDQSSEESSGDYKDEKSKKTYKEDALNIQEKALITREDQKQSDTFESKEKSDKFIYHHDSSTVGTLENLSQVPSFQGIQFSDDNNLMRFWKEQPLISDDFKSPSRTE